MSTPIEQAINAALVPIDSPHQSSDGMPYATHKGVLELVPGLRINCFRLNTGQTVIDQQGLNAFLEFLGNGPTA